MRTVQISPTCLEWSEGWNAVKPPEPLGREEHSKEKRCVSDLWPTFLEKPELAGAGVCLHLLQQNDAATTGREITFDLGVPFRLVALGEPSSQHCLLVFRQLLDRVLEFGEVHSPGSPSGERASYQGINRIGILQNTRRKLLSASEDRRHNAGVASSMHHSHNPQRLFVRCVGDRIFTYPDEAQRSRSQVQASVALTRKRNQGLNGVEVSTSLRMEVTRGHEPGCCERRAAALFSRK